MKAFVNLSWGVILAAAASLIFTAGCVPAGFTVGGKLSGATGAVGLSLNGTEALSVTKNGYYKFKTALSTSAAYNVTVTIKPAGQTCSVVNGSGAIASANISNVNVTCLTVGPPAITKIWPASVLSGYEVKISGSNLDLASITFNGAAIESTLRTENELRFIAPENPNGTYLLELENVAGYTSQNVAQGGTVMSNVISVDSGESFSCALLDTAEVKCWGMNYEGQLGNSSTIHSPVPVTVTGINNAVSVSAGSWHSCAALNTGEIKCWGYNTDGELGNGTTSHGPYGISTPVTVTGISNAVEVRAGYTQTCALLSTGEVQCWGDNKYGELGNNTTSASSTPVTVTGISNAVSVSTGRTNSCAALNSGSVQCWGINTEGQLGDASRINSSIPVTVTGIGNAVSVSAGEYHNCALLSTGEVQCWGWNDYGRLGNGSTLHSSIPVTVIGISDAVSVTAGYGHSCARLSTGAVKCWGLNYFGQLGNGSTIDSSIPVTVTGLSDIVSVSAGYSHNCATRSTGVTQCWGDNYLGKLGNGAISYMTTVGLPVYYP